MASFGAQSEGRNRLVCWKRGCQDVSTQVVDSRDEGCQAPSKVDESVKQTQTLLGDEARFEVCEFEEHDIEMFLNMFLCLLSNQIVLVLLLNYHCLVVKNLI